MGTDENMKFKYSLTQMIFILGYLGLILFGVIFNSPSESNVKTTVNNQKDYNLATLVDNKGHFLVYNKNKYEVWIDLEFMKKRNEYWNNKSTLNSKYSDDELGNKKFLFWGVYDTEEEAKESLGDMRRFANIYVNQERVYNNLFSYDSLIGNYKTTQYGIEKYLHENGLLKEKSTIRLSLDNELQNYLYYELKKTVEEKKANGAVAIVMDTKTGKIRASVSIYPWNLGYMGYIEPGSTLKPMIYALALDEKIITENEKFESTYNYKPEEDLNFIVTESEGYGLGELNIRDALILSSNISIAKVMKKIKEEFSNEWIYERLISMGFGTKTDAEFKGEIDGVLKYPDNWYSITPYQIALGQGIGVTPIQLISTFNSLVNNGIYKEPTFLENKESEARRVFSEEISEKLVEWMNYVTISGTAKLAYREGMLIGGKTGTAQKAIAGEGYNEEAYYSLFEGYYPATNPRYTFLVIVDNPQGEFYGGEVAAPVVTEAFYKYEKDFSNLETKKIIFKNVMPNIEGMYIHEAVNFLISAGVSKNDIIITGNGDYVEEQYPKPGVLIDKNRYFQIKTAKME
ncbi:cell division protein FtsI (penicillin-binding protein 3) [Geotoga petraea]|uniref:Cell division protein FtsI (Penicillin-binding protein 3) n=2 Tax=Geotoga petraea TaxID=28234 RepID=A0A1G6M3Z4_9BACT|nr:cell division protein FtsI (penicillin-binding protein 3) [Geotoga petraea]